MSQIRLQKYLSECGVCSRRKAEEYLMQGRVKINGETTRILGTKINPEQDVIELDGSLIQNTALSKVYILLNKPRGYVTTTHDPEGRRTVTDLIQEIPERIYPVGRLDYLSEGLLLLTNDGDMANKIMHPRYEVEKVYEVKVFGAVSATLLKKLREGTSSSHGELKPKSVRVIKNLQAKTWLEFRLGEGKNREIRRICESHGLTVDKLRRVAIGSLSIEGISPGSYKVLTRSKLLKLMGMDKSGKKVREMSYLSPKRTKKLSHKVVNRTSQADDKFFKVFRKGRYYETLKLFKDAKTKSHEEQANLE